MLFDSFTGQSYRALSGQVATDRAVNLYAERVESNTGKAHYCLLSVPGIRAFVTLNGGPIRALSESNQPTVANWLFALAGPNLYKIDMNGTATLMGAVASNSTPAQIIPYSSDKLFVLSAGQAYAVTVSSNTIVPIVLPIAYAQTATYIDTYMVVSDIATPHFYISAVGDPTSWNALDVATKEASPDPLQAVFAANELLFLFGLETTEIWYDSGAANFPFQRYPGGGVWEEGTSYAWSICKVGDAIMWTGRDGRGQNIVFMARGLQYQRVSNHPIESLLGTNAIKGETLAYSYEENGHFFYVINNPTGDMDITLVYDLTTGMWHERGTFDGTNYHRQTWSFHAAAFFESTATGHYVGGSGIPSDTAGTVYLQQMDIFDFNGFGKRVMRISPHLTGEQRRVRYNNFVLDCDKTVASAIALRSSNDGGQTYGVEHVVTTVPNSESRVIFRNVGSARDKVFMVYSFTPCLQAWAAAYVNERAPAP